MGRLFLNRAKKLTFETRERHSAQLVESYEKVTPGEPVTVVANEKVDVPSDDPINDLSDQVHLRDALLGQLKEIKHYYFWKK